VGRYYVEDVRRFQCEPHNVFKNILSVAKQDGHGVKIGLEQEPGASGKSEIAYYVRELAGFTVQPFPATKNKELRAGPVSSQCEARNVSVVRGAWNEPWFTELENFPKGSKDDQVDSFNGAMQMLMPNAKPYASEDIVIETGRKLRVTKLDFTSKHR
jgi:predicted phage terminase large subunit-like protein